MQTNIYYAVKFEHPESKKIVYVQSSKIIYNGSTVNSINVQITTDITEAFLYKQFEQAQEVVDTLPSVYKNIQAEIFKVEKMIDVEALAEHVIFRDSFDEPLLSADAIFVSKETELQALITVDLLGVITQIAELSVNEYPKTQHEIKSRLKSIIDSEIELAWSVAKLARRE